MKKTFMKIKVIIVTLLVIVLSLIAFGGVFKKDKGVWENKIPDYQYGMDIEGQRELRFAIDTTEEEKYVYVDDEGNIKGEVLKDGTAVTEEEEKNSEENVTEETENTDNESKENDTGYSKETRTIKVNKDEDLTKENFEKAQKIIKERLDSQKISQYNMRIDDVTGKLEIDTANIDEDVSLVEDLAREKGEFKIVDYQNGIVLMDNSDIKNVSVVTSNQSSYSTYLQIEFNKEGTEKLRQISNTYVETPAENTEESTDENAEETAENSDEESEEAEKKYVTIKFDETTMMTTYFGEEMANGLLQISVGNDTTEYDEFKKNYDSAKVIADILNSGVLPVTYELETDNFVYSSLDKDMMIKSAVIAIILISILLIVKFKGKGMMAAILGIGYIALMSIVTRYTNVIFTINSVIAGSLIVFVNYKFMCQFIKNLEKDDNAYMKTFKEFYLLLVPVCVITVVFIFSNAIAISSIGMILFWGILLNLLYNVIFTRTVLNK